jgi:hypothetical protein
VRVVFAVLLVAGRRWGRPYVMTELSPRTPKRPDRGVLG